MAPAPERFDGGGGGPRKDYSPVRQDDCTDVFAAEDTPKSFLEKLKERIGITGGLKLNSDGDFEETWEFEEDTYSVAILSILKRGLPAATAELVVALVTPCIQVLILFTILHHLLSTPRHGDGGVLSDSVDSFVSVICFLLMGLRLSNEALEGIGKMCFCMRAFGGVYKGMKGPFWIAIVIAFMQFSLAIFTVGTSSLVIAEQPSAQDAFMNFVALAFLTEVDNLVISCRTVNRMLGEVDCKITVVQVKKAKQDEAEPWSKEMCILTNILVTVSMVVSACTFRMAEIALDTGEDNLLRFMQVPYLILAFALPNAALWFGSRALRTMPCAVATAFLCLAFVFVDQDFLQRNGYRMTPSLTPFAPFWFAALAVSSANSVVMDPFPFLRCPFQTPSLCWAMLIIAATQIQALCKFGT